MDQNSDLIPLHNEDDDVAPAFELERRGYNRVQVDEHVGWLEDRLREAEAVTATADTAVRAAQAEARKSREELEAGRPEWPAFGERIAGILTLAEQEAAAIRAKGESERVALSEDARRLAQEAERTHSRRIQEAEREAQAMLREAQKEADRVVHDAQEVAVREERESNRRLADLSRQRDAVHGQLLRLQEGLAAAMAPFAGAAAAEPAEGAPTAGPKKVVSLEEQESYQRA
jgi:cell division septum initiation protein DivIVA